MIDDTDPKVFQEAYPHLVELRRRALLVAVFGIIIFIVCMIYSQYILNFLEAPYYRLTDTPLTVSSPLDVFSLLAKSATIATLLLIMPFANFQILAFALPGLMPRERALAYWAFLLAPLAVLGLLYLVYYAVLPLLLAGLLRLTAHNLTLGWELPAYISLLMRATLVTTILLPVPVVTYFLLPRQLPVSRVKLLFFLFFIISAIITPGGMILADLGLTLLFGLVLLLFLMIKAVVLHLIPRALRPHPIVR